MLISELMGEIIIVEGASSSTFTTSPNILDEVFFSTDDEDLILASSNEFIALLEKARKEDLGGKARDLKYLKEELRS